MKICISSGHGLHIRGARGSPEQIRKREEQLNELDPNTKEHLEKRP
jgi:hypothetical protein